MSDQRRVVILVLALAVPAVGVAQTVGVAVGEPLPLNASEPAAHDRWLLELTGGFFLEAWDLNRSKEHLIGGAVSFSRRMTPNWTFGVETNLLYVNQEQVVDVFLPALSFMLRWSAFRVGATSVFLEGGGGVSYASDEVPENGTRFNLVSQTGFGFARPLNSRFDFVGGLRWLHVSNNSLNGRHHNPDIQALGLYIGCRVN